MTPLDFFTTSLCWYLDFSRSMLAIKKMTTSEKLQYSGSHTNMNRHLVPVLLCHLLCFLSEIVPNYISARDLRVDPVRCDKSTVNKYTKLNQR